MIIENIMMYLVNLTDSMGKNKTKTVNALDVKEAEAKAKEKYPDCEVGRICADKRGLDYYQWLKRKAT